MIRYIDTSPLRVGQSEAGTAGADRGCLSTHVNSSDEADDFTKYKVLLISGDYRRHGGSLQVIRVILDHNNHELTTNSPTLQIHQNSPKIIIFASFFIAH